MSKNDDKLQGLGKFFRHPKTGKYYRDDSGCAYNPTLNKIKRENYNFATIIPPKITNVVGYVKNREIKPTGGINDSIEYYKRKCFSKKEISNCYLDPLNLADYESVDFIRGSETAIYGSWTQNDPSSYKVGCLQFQDTSHSELRFVTAGSFVCDLCEGFIDGFDFFVVYNYSEPDKKRCVEHITGNSRNSLYRHGHFSDTMVYCCSFNRLYESWLLLGLYTKVVMFSLVDLSSDLPIFIEKSAVVKTIAMDYTGNMVASGTNTGNLYIHDTRFRSKSMSISISDYSLSDTAILGSHRVIVGGDMDVLCEVDLRNEKIITEFLDHKKQNGRKEPFSISNNMLCARGSDNKLRIWSLYGGLPIHEINPVNDPNNTIKGWLHTDGNKTHLYYFEGLYKKVFEIL